MCNRGERGRGGQRRHGQATRGASPGPPGRRGAPSARRSQTGRSRQRRGRDRARGFSPTTAESIQAPPEGEAELDSRIKTIEERLEKLTSEIPASSAFVHPIRPGFGKQGEEILVRANFFALKFTEGLITHDYNILRALENTPDFAAYKGIVAHDDSQRLVSAVPLQQPLVIEFDFIEDDACQPEPKKKYTHHHHKDEGMGRRCTKQK
ncbi:SubName: Full=Related to QDE-2 post-transcriptional gene silencing protein QDE-2 {ECO:0000313/EMBL:CCA71993.1} [Serendipita indica DSM 11827]|nr:SubName: Full=Related to QDE-2 post-transcriptional gene silencing protein QDE-2 {ECO:0000313/EMBL:CCA71993.1} [Serendipita indica DSM 11827]